MRLTKFSLLNLLKTKGPSFVRNSQGVAAVEFAFMLPILLVIVFGMYELSQYLESSQRTQRVAGIIADLVTRQPMTPDQVDSVLATAPYIFYPLDFTSGQGGLIVSGIADRDDGQGIRITWQRSYGAASASKLGAPGSPPSGFDAGLIPSPNQAIVAVETYFTYTPILIGGLLPNIFPQGSLNLYNISYALPRQGGMVDLE